MNELQWRAVIAGIFFGIWPLFMNRSGLSGNVSSAMFGISCFIWILPIALRSNGFTLPQANWWVVAAAGIFGALGLLSFNGMLAKATVKNVGTLFVLMTVVQIAVAALYQTVMTGRVTLDKAAGYATATLAAFLLLR